MSNDKTTAREPWKTAFNPAVNDEDASGQAGKKPVQVVSLEIDESDGGSDPYNHTGSFCVPEFEKD